MATTAKEKLLRKELISLTSIQNEQIKGLENEKNYWKAQVEEQKMTNEKIRSFCGASAPTGKIPGNETHKKPE